MPRPSQEVVHGGVENARVFRVHGEVSSSGRLVYEQHVIPSLTAVGGFEDATIGVCSPFVTKCSDVRHVRIGGMDSDPRDLLRLAEPDEGPCLAGVHRSEDTASHRSGVPRVALSGAHVNHVVIRWCDGDCADRGNSHLIEDRPEGGATVLCFENATGGMSEIESGRIARNAGDCGYSTAHDSRPNRSERKARERGANGGISAVRHWWLLRRSGRGNKGNQNRC